MADNRVGSIVIDAKLDKQDFMTNSKDVARAISSLKSTVAKSSRDMKASASGYGTAMRQVVAASREANAQIRDIDKSARELKASMDRLGKSRVASPEFKKVVSDIEKAEKEYTNLTNLKDKYLEYHDDKAADAAYEKLGKLEIKLELLKQKRDELINSGKAGVSGSTTAEFRDMQSRYNEIMQMRQKAMAQMGEDFKPPYLKYFESLPRLTGMISEGFGRIQNVASGAAYALTHPFQTLDRALGTVISTVGRAVSAFAKMAGNAAVSFLKRLASEARNAAVQLAKLAANAVSSGLKKIATWAHAAAQGVLNFHKNNKRAHSGMGTSLKMILKYAFGIRSLFFLFRRLRQAVTDGFGELKKQNPEVKAAIDSLSQACNGLKGSLAAAFSPILTAIAPALTTLINMLTAAINTIGAFFAALTGKNTVAKSIGKIGSSAGKAGGKVKELKRELAGFDELNILNGDNNSGGGGGSGSGSGFAYENVPIESGIKDFADRMKELWAAEDFEGIGKEIAGYINKGIDKIDQLISWDNVKDNVSKGVQAVVGIFNGLIDPVDGINFDKLGKTVSDGVETILNAFALLLDPNTGLSFSGAGVALARALNGFLGNPLMWNMAAKVLSMSARAFIKFSKALLWEFDEGKVATNIRNAIAQPGLWDGIAKSAWDAIKLAFNKAGNFVNVLLGGNDYGNAWGEAERMMRARPANIIPDVSYNGMWDELATNLGTGIKKAIGDLAEKISEIPVDETVRAVVDWFNKVVSEALGDGNEVGELFGTLIQKMFDGVGTLISGFNQNAKWYGQRIAAILRTMIRTAFNGSNPPSKVFTNAVMGAFNFIEGFLQGFKPEDAANELKKAVSDIPWGDIAKEAWNAFKTAVEKLGNFLTVLFGGEVEVDAENSVDAVEQMWKRGSKSQNRDTGGSGLTKAIGSAVSSALDMLDSWINGIDWNDLGTKIHDTLAALPWDEWGEKLAHALNDLLDGLDDLVFSGLYGENYQENDAWRILHPGKAAKYDFEQKTSGSENASRIISEREYTPEKYMELQKLANQDAAGADARGDTKLANAIFDAQQEMAELDHAIAVADAPGIVAQMRANDASYDEIAAAMLELGLTVEEGAAAINGNTVANESNTTAIDANTEVQPSQPEQTEKMTDELDGLPDAVQLAIDVIKDGTMPGDVAELLNLTDESNKILQDYLDKHPEIVTGAHEDKGPNGDYTLNLTLDENGEPQYKGVSKTKSPAAKVQEKARDKIAEHQNQVTTESTESTNKLSKVSGKLAKLLKGGITTEGTTEVTLKGDSVEALNGKSSVNVGVNFVPGEGDEGDEGDDEAKNGGLLGWLQSLLDPGVSVETKVNLIKNGWDNFWTFVGSLTSNPIINTAIELIKQGGWTGFLSFLGANSWTPLVETLVDILNGRIQETDAVNAIRSAGKQLSSSVSVGISKAGGAVSNVVQYALQLLTGGGKTNVDGKVNVAVKKSQGDSTAEGAVESATTSGGITGTVHVMPVHKSGDKIAEDTVESNGKTNNVGIKAGLDTKSDKTATGVVNADGTTKDVLIKAKSNGTERTKKIIDMPETGTTKNIGFLTSLSKSKDGPQNAEQVYTPADKSVQSYTSLTKGNTGAQKASEVYHKDEKQVNGLTHLKKDSVGAQKASEVYSKEDKQVNGLVSLKKDGWDTIGKFVGDAVKVVVSLTNSGSNWASGILKWLTGSVNGIVDIIVNLTANTSSSGGSNAEGGIITPGGNSRKFSAGGYIMNSGRASWWDSVNKYAAGTSKAHGTVFVAGEAGPEIMGHVNGRTEILNKSQLAEAIYGAVVSGMAKAVNALGSYLANHMSTCTNAIVSTIGATAQLNAVRGLNYYEPAVTSGGIMPYDVSAQIARSTTAIQGTLDANNEDLIQAMISAIGSASMQIVAAIQAQMRTGGNNLSAQQLINEINRQGMMYGTTPIKGV